MQIIVNHLTKMSAGFVCVAGICTETGAHIRPCQLGRLESYWFAVGGGPFDMAEIVDLGSVKHVGEPPEVEDHRFFPSAVVPLGPAQPSEFWQLLRQSAQDDLTNIFGPDLRPHGATYTVDRGKGCCSLGLFKPSGPVSLFVSQFGSVRCSFRLPDREDPCYLPVTDARLFEFDEWARNDAAITAARERLRRGVPVLLSVGLTRPYAGAGGEPCHWLQVNNLHFEDDPLWRLAPLQ